MAADKEQLTESLSGGRTSLAVKRTLMAADRTLMAWLRTALSMISFGFTIYKILQGLQGIEDANLADKFDARNVGEFLVGIGTLSMVMGTVEYWFTIRELTYRERIRVWIRPAFVMSLIISLAGLVIFTSLVVKLI
jgi:putative membrane protein